MNKILTCMCAASIAISASLTLAADEPGIKLRGTWKDISDTIDKELLPYGGVEDATTGGSNGVRVFGDRFEQTVALADSLASQLKWKTPPKRPEPHPHPDNTWRITLYYKDGSMDDIVGYGDYKTGDVVHYGNYEAVLDKANAERIKQFFDGVDWKARRPGR